MNGKKIYRITNDAVWDAGAVEDALYCASESGAEYIRVGDSLFTVPQEVDADELPQEGPTVREEAEQTLRVLLQKARELAETLDGGPMSMGVLSEMIGTITRIAEEERE